MSKDRFLGAGSEQCCENKDPERSCAKTKSNTNCYTNRERNSNSNNRPYNDFYQWPTIMRSDVLFQAHADRQTQTMMAIQI